jgi:hypothetical protein
LDLSRVHRRYIRVSNYFKSAWTFHQFLQGLQKVFADGGVRDYPADFQPIYGDLKQIANIDDTIAPSLLRQFFQRVKNYDDNILTQLVKFYLYSHSGRSWNLQRLDKLDFLNTKFAE